jgi:hypothetical protein
MLNWSWCKISALLIIRLVRKEQRYWFNHIWRPQVNCSFQLANKKHWAVRWQLLMEELLCPLQSERKNCQQIFHHVQRSIEEKRGPLNVKRHDLTSPYTPKRTVNDFRALMNITIFSTIIWSGMTNNYRLLQSNIANRVVSKIITIL